MRVIAGVYKSRILKDLKHNDTRPTLDKIKGAVFSSINNKIINAKFLDLFSGTGSIGIEAVSRGCEIVYFNEINHVSYNLIKDNINMLKIMNYKLSKQDYKVFLSNNNHNKFDIIYLDPPFEMNYDEIINEINKYEIFNYNSILIIESKFDLQLLDVYDNLYKYNEKKYGSIKITYYKYGGN